MEYECEFVGGHVSPVAVCGGSGQYLIGVAKDHRGLSRALFFHYELRGNPDPIHHPDPWIAAIRPQASRPRLAEV